MDEQLNFSLPEKKSGGSTSNIISIALLLVLIALVAMSLLHELKQAAPRQEAAGQMLSTEDTENLAIKLSQRDLYSQAAEVWKKYLTATKLNKTERAKRLFEIGTLLEKGGDLAGAVEYYYRSEMTAPLDELAEPIKAHTKSCFEKLGNFSALRYELMARTSIDKNKQAGGKVVAEIGPEKITEAQLDALIEHSVDNQLAAWAVLMSPEQAAQQKKQMLDKYKEPQARLRFLKNWLGQEVLYRQALEQGLQEKPQVKQLEEDLSRGLLSSQLMNEQLAAKVHVTETDLESYYAANKDKYVEPAHARIRHILAGDEALAKGLIERTKGGEDFATLAEENSLDQNTRQKGGEIDQDITVGSYVAGIGDAKGLNEKIFAAKPGTVLDEPFKTEKGWEVIKVELNEPERQKSFDEVRQNVLFELTGRKRDDVQQEFVREMMDKYGVTIHTSAFGAEKQEQQN